MPPHRGRVTQRQHRPFLWWAEIDRPWNFNTNDRLGITDYLGAEEVVVGFSIGSPAGRDLSKARHASEGGLSVSDLLANVG